MAKAGIKTEEKPMKQSLPNVKHHARNQINQALGDRITYIGTISNLGAVLHGMRNGRPKFEHF